MKIKSYYMWIENKKHIAFYFSYNEEIIKFMKMQRKSRWNPKHKFWYIPYYENLERDIKMKLPNGWQIIEGKERVPRFFDYNGNGDIIPLDYLSYLKENYCRPTCKGYRNTFANLLFYYPKKHPDEITMDEIKIYLMHLIKDLSYAVSSQNKVINSIKSYYQNINGLVIDKKELPRPKKPKKLPVAISEEEVSRIFHCLKNLKHKSMIYLVYSCGLRLTEVVHIKKEHLDLEKKRILITSPRPEENRYVGLSKTMEKILRQYLKVYKTEVWLFEGYPGKQFLRRTLQRAFFNARLESGIQKAATFTVLRNSYAVHLIERGVDIRYIQRMMGHKSTKTTMRFLQISSKDFRHITSPLDNLNLED